jgi:N-acetylneuraminic acid mutarotase
MRARTLLLVLLCGACKIDLTGICLPPATCADTPGGGGSGGGGGSRGGLPRLAFREQPSSAAEGVAITPAIQIAILDGAGGVVASASDSITIRISDNSAGGTLAGTTTVAARSGVATFADLSIDQRGQGYRLEASTARYGTMMSGHFNVTCTCWSRRAPMPTARDGMAVVAVNGVLFALGGHPNSPADVSRLASVEGFEAAANTWTTKAPMPTERSNLAAGVVNGIVYAVGGFNRVSLATLEAYDPATDSWTTRAPMPTARSGLAVGVVNGVLYAVGGHSDAWGSAGDLATVEAYDPVTNSWTTKAPMPTARSGLAVGVVNGVLYAVGGYSGRTTVEAFDPVANSWTSRAPMPTDRHELAVAVVNGVLYAVGGGGFLRGIYDLATIEAYDPVANRWTNKGPMPTGRSSLGVGVVNGLMYALGGSIAGWPLGRVEAYDPSGER